MVRTQIARQQRRRSGARSGFCEAPLPYHCPSFIRCSICRLDADELSPVTMRLGLFVVLGVVCARCSTAEHQAAVAYYSRIAGKA